MGRYRKPVAPGAARFAGTPLARVLGALTGRWSVLALEAVHEGCSHFNELQRRLDGISHKVLVDTLRALQRDGFVHGPLTCEGRSEYRPTMLGAELVALIGGIRAWSDERGDELATVRARFEDGGLPSRAAGWSRA
ncbi:winged helix-turn-helix transcriptional regulator [Amycolatopsis sp. H20-H5]|uniref:winged helix-turn-helix transcriptional regulator n=1 Tax=Amycolatopsis sp. H20-H5 TaxID=3046309 RepID=UPI002DBE5D98|nr:helix-turn-helix domain-containing protein [Amycolatopsis sp. H20-H5]MEC3976083.1 helix-turn-helix domain-containing protein [Amycolatopsis sp. H20-H5]